MPPNGRQQSKKQVRVTLFDEQQWAPQATAARRRTRSRGVVTGIWAFVIALVALLGMSLLPSPYVIERPGPVYNTIGEVTDDDDTSVPLISVSGAETFPTAGALDLLTVQVIGTPERPNTWLDIATAWFDGSKAVVPIEQIYPSGQTSDQRNQENTLLMTDSQMDATAAALIHLGYDVVPQVTVSSVVDGSAADGVLQSGDVLVTANGTKLTDATALRSIVQEGAGAPVTIDLRRDGGETSVQLTPIAGTGDAAGTWKIGVVLQNSYAFPLDVSFALDNVGGPSAGMMFALGIIDTLTPGELNGGRQVAGTGTIAADGTVGPIGGIRQKMWGAERAGAEYFLAPNSNCSEVSGHVPSGLRVFSVSTLDDALAALDAISSGGDLDALPTCAAG